MPKGEGSPRFVLLAADALEERWLLSHLATGTTSHAASVAHVSVPIVPKAESEPARPSTASASDLPERDAEPTTASAEAASTDPRNSYTVPLVLSSSPGEESEDVSTTAGTSGLMIRSIRVNSGDPFVAWGGSGYPSSPHLLAFRDWSRTFPESPETLLDRGTSPSMTPIGSDRPGQPTIEAIGELATRGADLLAPYLPFASNDLERVIDRLIDGVDFLGTEIPRLGDDDELILTPIAWGIGLATIELVRRRLRPRLVEDDRADRDPALGLHGCPA